MTKSITIILSVLILASFAFGTQKQSEWITYSSPEGHYVVSLPGEPRLTTQESTTADGEKFPQYLASSLKSDNFAFMVAYFDIVPGTTFSADAARDGMVGAIKGTLLSETAISLGGYPGREFKASATPEPGKPAAGDPAPEAVQYIVRARLYEVDKRIYILQAIFPKSLENDETKAEVAKYFDSFQVVKK